MKSSRKVKFHFLKNLVSPSLIYMCVHVHICVYKHTFNDVARLLEYWVPGTQTLQKNWVLFSFFFFFTRVCLVFRNKVPSMLLLIQNIQLLQLFTNTLFFTRGNYASFLQFFFFKWCTIVQPRHHWLSTLFFCSNGL